MLGFIADTVNKVALIPGLRITAETTSSGTQSIAKIIRFSAGDMKRATEVQPALAVPQQEAAALREKVKAQEQMIATQQQQIAAMQKQIATRQAEVDKRFSELADYDVKSELTILFDVNSAKLSNQAMQDLQALAANAKTFKGYLIQVAGYTDSDGSASTNQALSDRRAESVVNYLRQSFDVALSRVLAAVAMRVSPGRSRRTKQRGARRKIAVSP